jgi:hypothetical protein
MDHGARAGATAAAWLCDRQQRGATTAEALAFFDGLAPLPLEGLIGRWRGSGLATGHPMDGLLEAFGWYGKEFIDREAVHPLLFRGRGGQVDAVNPGLVPMGLVGRHPTFFRRPALRVLFAALRPLLSTTRPGARLRTVEHRGVLSAAMIYDAAPIIDLFRLVEPDTLLGLMDMRAMEQPFFFVLRRDEAP